MLPFLAPLHMMSDVSASMRGADLLGTSCFKYLPVLKDEVSKSIAAEVMGFNVLMVLSLIPHLCLHIII